MEDNERKERLKSLIMLGKECGFLTYAEIREALPQHLSPPLHPRYADPQWRERRIDMDDEQLHAIAETFREMGIEVRQ